MKRCIDPEQRQWSAEPVLFRPERNAAGSIPLPRAVLLLAAAAIAAVFLGAVQAAGEAETAGEALPVEGMVTMIDLGATQCIPCKMMAPIMVKLEKEYQGRAAIVFIDVWKNKDMARRFGVRAIPTQVFFDETGREVYRHVGFLDEDAIRDRLRTLGVEAPPGNG